MAWGCHPHADLDPGRPLSLKDRVDADLRQERLAVWKDYLEEEFYFRRSVRGL